MGERFRIDLHAHLVPPFYREALRRVGVTRVAGLPLPAWTAPAAMRFMDRFGIQAQVVSVSEPGVAPFAGGAAVELARRVNDYEAELVARHPTRFGALALLPLPQVDHAVAEAARALDELGLDGVVLSTSYGGRFLGHPDFAPLLAELDRRAAYVFVHPVAPGADDRPPLPVPPFLYEFTFDTTRAVADLVVSGAVARYPRIRWHFAHAGGAAPVIAGRLPGVDAEAALARLYYDTALSHGPAGLQALRRAAPIDHIVFGTDWPYGQALTPTAGDPQPEVSRTFSPSERRAIERAHALRLVPRLARTLERAT